MNEEETKMAKSGEDQHEFRTTNLKNINNNNDYVGQIRRSYFSYWTYSQFDWFSCGSNSTGHLYLPPRQLAPRPVPVVVSDPVVLLFPSPPVLQRTVAASVVDKLVPLAPAAFHTYKNKGNEHLIIQISELLEQKLV